MVHIETNDGERRVMTIDEHNKMKEKWGKNLPYNIIRYENSR